MIHSVTSLRLVTIRVLSVIAASLLLQLGAVTALALEPNRPAEDPVNAMCPVGKEAIDPETPTLAYGGATIGFCCPGCEELFVQWTTAEKDEFVRLARAGREPGQAAPTSYQEQHDETPSTSGDPYLLAVCPVSGEALGSMGDPAVETINGREVRFCCSPCIEKFKKNLDVSFEKVDRQMIDRQTPYYPLDVCVVSGEPLDSMGDPVDRIYGNRLVRFCCEGCVRDFEKNPEDTWRRLEKAATERQREQYPFDTCLVSGEPLGSMGDPVDKVYGHRLVRFCCTGCVKKFEANPTESIHRLDEAWRARRANTSDREPSDRRGHSDHDH